jgi:radical SAM protein with 4Fe4S-binding SPASM domain
MQSWNDLKARFTTHNGRAGQPAALPVGVHHYLRENAEHESKVRLHLRIDADGHGLLMANASRVYHFNPTAALMAYLALENIPENQAVQTLTRQFNVPRRQALQDFQAFAGQLSEIIQPDGGCAVCDLQLETTAPFSDRPSAPYRMDLAVTYRCSNECAHCYNARPRSYPELSTSEWKQILDRLWQIGIPHIVFTGGEPTLRDDLPELIAHAERNGQITGINTNGRRLRDPQYLQALVESGLDHVQITLESHDAAIHDDMVARKGAWEQTVAGVRNALVAKLFVMTNTTMLESNAPSMDATLDFLAELGVPTVGLNALIYSGAGASVGNGLPEADLPPLLIMARQKTQRNSQRLIWYTPTQYCHFDPLMLNLGVKGCTAALYNMCIEPDGAVIPCQSYYETLGNLLADPWESIWNHELAVRLRERADVPDECHSCALLPECGGGCPLARQTPGSKYAPKAIHPLQTVAPEI